MLLGQLGDLLWAVGGSAGREGAAEGDDFQEGGELGDGLGVGVVVALVVDLGVVMVSGGRESGEEDGGDSCVLHVCGVYFSNSCVVVVVCRLSSVKIVIDKDASVCSENECESQLKKDSCFSKRPERMTGLGNESEVSRCDETKRQTMRRAVPGTKGRVCC